MISKKIYTRPQIGAVYLEDSLMDQNFASWVVDDGDKIPVDGDDDDDTPEDAKRFNFESEWGNWNPDE